MNNGVKKWVYLDYFWKPDLGWRLWENIIPIAFSRRKLFSVLLYVYFGLFWAKMAHFLHFSPYLTKICHSKYQRGLFPIRNHTCNRLKVVPSLNFAIFIAKLQKTKEKNTFDPFLVYKWRHSPPPGGWGWPKIWYARSGLGYIYI